ncbi:MAG: NAD(P)/FAD-dependent oxidoreductase, partial [Proteobacteria bacterium]|nr:NAD(P)/FAD-dependent oxidoreductase [Pseudomonadota bacterium]
ELPGALAHAIKHVTLTVTGLGGLQRAISTAGGIALDEIDGSMMLKQRPGIFVCGEMLDWEAPTGGYLLQACFSTGHAAGKGVLQWLAQHAMALP